MTLTFHACFSHLVFRAFTDSLNCIADSVEMYLRQNLEDNNIKILPFTTAVVVTYMDGKIIHPHCDQQYSSNGEFLESQNSQERDTATVILVIGDTRNLNFDLWCYENTAQKEVEHWGCIELAHGSLFILDPRTEKPEFRHGLEKYGRTFFKHSCKGIKEKKAGMSIGIVFRATIHLAEVHCNTGLVVLDDKLNLKMMGVKEEREKKKKTNKEIEEEKKMFQERNEILKHYMAGKTHPMNMKAKKNQRKGIDEPKVRKLWEKCRVAYLSMRRIEEEEEEDGDDKERGV